MSKRNTLAAKRARRIERSFRKNTVSIPTLTGLPDKGWLNILYLCNKGVIRSGKLARRAFGACTAIWDYKAWAKQQRENVAAA